MKRIILVPVFLVASFSVLRAQKAVPTKFGQAFIEIGGAKLRLGMSKSDVAEKLAGSSINKADEDTWFIGPPGPSIQFTNGRLSFVDRSWSQTDDIAESLFGVVSSFNSDGYSLCEVTAGTNTSPEMTSQNVWIHCGEKTIVVSRHSISGKFYRDVTEQLGSWRDVSK